VIKRSFRRRVYPYTQPITVAPTASVHCSSSSSFSFSSCVSSSSSCRHLPSPRRDSRATNQFPASLAAQDEVVTQAAEVSDDPARWTRQSSPHPGPTLVRRHDVMISSFVTPVNSYLLRGSFLVNTIFQLDQCNPLR